MTTLATLRSTAVDQGALLGSSFIGSEHLFLAWLLVADGAVHDAITSAGVTPDGFRALIAVKQGGVRAIATAEIGGLSSHAQRVIGIAEELAQGEGRTEANTDDVLLALIREPRGAVARALTEAKLKPSALRVMLRPRVPKAKAPRKDTRPATNATPEKPTAVLDRGPSAPPVVMLAAQNDPARREKPKRDPETDDIPWPRAPDRPRLVPPPKPSPLISHDTPPVRWSWIWVLLLAVPVSLVLHFNDGDRAVIFVIACLGMIPLASLMATATEHLADRTGPTIGALLNAAFGNATELIVAIAALNAGYFDLVKASLTGSILSNLLLILGFAFFTGGLRQRTLHFDRTVASVSGVMLALAVAALILPSMLGPTIAPEHVALLSQVVAVVLAVTYALSLIFTLGTHKPAVVRTGSGDSRHWAAGVALLVLAITTVGVFVESKLLVDTIGAVTTSFHLSHLFVGLIVIPIIGNAAEHATAIVAARRGKMELAVQIAIGSSTQVALLVAPLLILVAALLGSPMTLVFPMFQVIALGIGVAVAALITLDGESHWLEGAQLLALYVMIAAAAWFI